MEILFPFQNSDKIMLYHTALFECNISHVKFSAYFLSHLCIGSLLKSQTVYFNLFYGKWTFLTFSLLKIVFSHFFLFKCYAFNNKILGKKHSHFWNAAQLTSQNTHFFSQTLHRFFFFLIKIQFPFQTLAKFMYFIYPINFTRPLTQISNHFQS